MDLQQHTTTHITAKSFIIENEISVWIVSVWAYETNSITYNTKNTNKKGDVSLYSIWYAMRNNKIELLFSHHALNSIRHAKRALKRRCKFNERCSVHTIFALLEHSLLWPNNGMSVWCTVHSLMIVVLAFLVKSFVQNEFVKLLYNENIFHDAIESAIVAISFGKEWQFDTRKDD